MQKKMASGPSPANGSSTSRSGNDYVQRPARGRQRGSSAGGKDRPRGPLRVSTRVGAGVGLGERLGTVRMSVVEVEVKVEGNPGWCLILALLRPKMKERERRRGERRRRRLFIIFMGVSRTGFTRVRLSTRADVMFRSGSRSVGAYYVGQATTHRTITIALSKHCNCRVFGR